jgi:hypothetical protein
MASMKEHLAEFHSKESKLHAAKAEHHAALAGHFGQLAKCMAKSTFTEATKDSEGILEALAAEHAEQSQQHTEMSAYHAECADKCSKAMDSDLSKLTPTSISGIAPERPGLRAIPRIGQREIPTRLPVDTQFEKLFAIDDEPNMKSTHL